MIDSSCRSQSSRSFREELIWFWRFCSLPTLSIFSKFTNKNLTLVETHKKTQLHREEPNMANMTDYMNPLDVNDWGESYELNVPDETYEKNFRKKSRKSRKKSKKIRKKSKKPKKKSKKTKKKSKKSKKKSKKPSR